MINGDILQRDIEDAIQAHEDEEDKTGRSKLIQIADAINLLPRRDPLKGQASDIIVGLIDQINDLTPLSAQNLLHFIELSFIDKKEICDQISTLIRSTKKPVCNPIIRAELIRFLLENSIYLPARIISNDTEILEADKWLWIDIMAYTNWNLAFQKILESINERDAVKNLIARLPYYWRKLGQKEMMDSLTTLMQVKTTNKNKAALSAMIEYLTGEDKSPCDVVREPTIPEDIKRFLTDDIIWNDDPNAIFTTRH